jgi:hypothetical protein
MTAIQLRARNRAMLRALDPAIRDKIEAVLADLQGHGFRPRIQDAWRSPAEQRALYDKGRSRVKFGFHNVTVAGRASALAADILDDDHPLAPSRRFLLQLFASASAHGLTTGLMWGLSAKEAARTQAAVHNRNWDAQACIGWDPCHVQVVGITIAQARRGERP